MLGELPRSIENRTEWGEECPWPFSGLWPQFRESPCQGGERRIVSAAWALRSPLVSAPIVGATKPHHLSQAVGALDLQMSGEEADALEEPYTNAGPSWF
ncbi:aldo/keto reductase [Streptomyces sp. NPDC002677]|uniref:aldo/keto reductase n=1 Tax=Streptomyces sp. NPDC002677 TaxID=3154774 RepID=UPI003320D902